MSNGDDSALDEARRHHLKHVNGVLRRPGMYGRDEIPERLLLEAMAAVDGSLTRWRAEWDRLRDSDAFTATGVRGAYSDILPADALREATASVYAEIAHRLGWLELDRALSAAEHQQYRDDDLICLHLWNAFATGSRRVHPEPVLLAVRHRPGPFPDAFSFTPEGQRRRPSADQHSPLRPVVWIFHGYGARHASGVFETLDAGLAWAAEHEVSGILAEYPIGGAYDVAVSEGRFTPSKEHHGTADHVAAFSPGLRHIHLTDGRPD